LRAGTDDGEDGKSGEKNGKTDEGRRKSETVKTLRGTTFFGGAGMNGKYITDMVEALNEVGVMNARSADSEKWSNGTIADVIDVLDKRNRDDQDSDLSAMGKRGERFNLIGYSYGALQASQAAIDHADKGGEVDHLVLIGAPISGEFLEKLKKHPNIGKVEVIDLGTHGDPIKAGMSTGELFRSVPKLGFDFSSNEDEGRKGHFYYGGKSKEGKRRRRELAKRLHGMGLR